MPRTEGSLGHHEGFRPLLPGPEFELSESQTRWWLDAQDAHSKGSMALILVSFYLADLLSVASEIRVAAQMPTEPDRVNVGQMGDNTEWWRGW